MIKKFVFVLIGFVLLTGTALAQNGAAIGSDELNFDFGTIAEDGGTVSHVFVITNSGTAPLVITHVTVSCGCTTPEWGKAPIAAGKTGEVKITYDPKGRPGPFAKTAAIYSNGKQGPYRVAIKGNVTPKKIKPVFLYPYSVGTLKMHTKDILYSGIRPTEILGEKILVKNEGEASVTIHIGKHPAFLNINASPSVLTPGESGEITILLDAHGAKRLGRISSYVPLTVSTPGSKNIAESAFHVSANIIDDFSRMTSAEKTNAPLIALSSDLLDYGVLNGKGGKAVLTLDVSNNGKSDLLIRSIGSDDERIDVSGGRRVIKPGATTSFKVVIRPKDIRGSLESIINVISNDPDSPVRLIKVMAKQ